MFQASVSNDGTDGIEADLLGAKLDRQVFGAADNCSLACAVPCQARATHDTSSRRDIDHGSWTTRLPRLPESWDHHVNTVEHRLKVDINAEVKVLFCGVENWLGLVGRAGIVDDKVDTAESLLGLGKQILPLLMLGNVAVHVSCLAACLVDLVGHTAASVIVLEVSGKQARGRTISVTTTATPSLANFRAMPAPKPDPAPVTIATRCWDMMSMLVDHQRAFALPL